MRRSRGFTSGLVVRLGAAAVVVTSLVGLVRQPVFDAFRQVRADERVYRDVLKWMVVDGIAGAPVLMVQMTGAANYYEPGLRFLRFDRLSPEAWRALRDWQQQHGRPIHAALALVERERSGPASTLPPCDWRPRSRYRWATFWECPPDDRTSPH
jgi:hypothetical protein